MFDTAIVRGVIVAYLALSCFVVFIMWQNAASDDALKNAGIAFAAILPLCVAILPYLEREVFKSDSKLMILYDVSEKAFSIGEGPNPYSIRYIDFLFCDPQIPPQARPGDDDFDNIALDVVEKGILEKLGRAFGKHWDIEIKESANLEWERISYGPRNRYSTSKLTPEEVKSVFCANTVMNKPSDSVQFTSLFIPDGAKINTAREGLTRTINIDSKTATLTIKIQQLSINGIAGIWGVIKHNLENRTRYYSLMYSVQTELRLRRFRRYSPEAAAYREWHSNITRIIIRLDWSRIENDIAQSMTNRATAKILELDKDLPPYGAYSIPKGQVDGKGTK